MATAAEPRPATLPLPGGSAGATVLLHPLLTARLAAPPGLMRREGGRLAGLKLLGVGVGRERYVDMPVTAFLVDHPTAGNVLIDTGFHGSVAIEPGRAMGRLGGLIYRDVRMQSEDAAPAQLRALGIAADQVGTVVMTHLHADHSSGIAHFPDATFVVSAAEWSAAASGGEREGYVRRQFDHGFDYRLVDFDGPGTDSFASFGHALDLFGDGSVTLVSTPGHSAGHLSVVLRLGGREALIAGDAIYTLESLRDGHLPHRVVDEHRYRRSLREIGLYAEQTPGALVIPSHDIELWEALAPVY